MIYIYAYTNHKSTLSRLRRMAVVQEMLLSNGLKVQMLTNDFRASSISRDLGVPSCITIQTIIDIDMVAEHGDIVIIDSPEDDMNKFEIYRELFEKLIIIGKDLKIGPMVSKFFIDNIGNRRNDRSLLFFGDADPKKELLLYKQEFSSLKLELLLGTYYYPNYENELSDSFIAIHESGSYRSLILASKIIITTSLYTAYEASVSGAKTILLSDFNYDDEQMKILLQLQIKMLSFKNIKKLHSIMTGEFGKSSFEAETHNRNIKEKLITNIKM